MGLFSEISNFFGLDIGTTAVRLVELHGKASPKKLYKYGSAPIDEKLAVSDSKSDHIELGRKIKEIILQSGITTRNVAVGLPSQRVFMTVVDMDKINPNEFYKYFKYQADSIIPTPVSESKIDMAILGQSPQSPNKVEVLVSSAPNTYIESRLDMLESIGLNVVAFEPDTMAMSRSLISPNTTTPNLLLDIGNKSTDLVVVMDGVPRLTRSIPTGAEAIIKSAMQNLNIDYKQAEQFVFKFGLSEDKLEGQVHQAIIGTVEVLLSEIEKSIKFFQTRYKDKKIDKIVVTGGAATLPSFPLYVANKFGLNVEIGNSWRNILFAKDRENELLALSNHFSVAVGLAGRQE